MFSSTASRSMARTFARANGSAGITSREPLTIDRIRAVAPSVFADNRHESRSERYTFIPTSQIVEHWTQSGSRDETKRGLRADNEYLGAKSSQWRPGLTSVSYEPGKYADEVRAMAEAE